MRTPYIPHVFGKDVEAKLGERMGWLVAAVTASIAWPQDDVWLVYDGDEYVLRGALQGGEPAQPSILIPCSQEQIDDALSRLYRFVSVLSWFKRGFVDISGYVSGSRPIRYSHLKDGFAALTLAGMRAFSCNHMPIVENDRTRKALAFMREGRRLRHVHEAYSFLSYFKVLESQFGAKVRQNWVEANLDHLEGNAAARVAKLRSEGVNVNAHLYHSCRCAVAHASIDGVIVDPDIPSDRRRIAEDLVIIEALATRYLKIDAAVPDEMALYTSRDRLVPWHNKMTEQGLAILKAGGSIDDETLLGELNGATIAVRLWPDAPAPEFQSMTIVPVEAGPGFIKFFAHNERKTIFLAFVMDVANGRLHTDLEKSGRTNTYGEITEDEVAAYTRYFHSVIGNRLVELTMAGAEPVECEVVIPVNIIPRDPEEAVAEAVTAFRRPA